MVKQLNNKYKMWAAVVIVVIFFTAFIASAAVSVISIQQERTNGQHTEQIVQATINNLLKSKTIASIEAKKTALAVKSTNALVASVGYVLNNDTNAAVQKAVHEIEAYLNHQIKVGKLP